MIDEKDDDGVDAFLEYCNATPEPDAEAEVIQRILPLARAGVNHEKIREMLVKMLKGDGASCPCCGQKVVLYRRKLNTNMARFLIRLVKEYERTGQGVRHEVLRSEKDGRDYSYITKWGLAETFAPEKGEDKKDSGLWKPTPKGIDFAYNRLTVPARVFLYDNQIVGWDTQTCSVEEALGQKWSWSELMGK